MIRKLWEKLGDFVTIHPHQYLATSLYLVGISVAIVNYYQNPDSFFDNFFNGKRVFIVVGFCIAPIIAGSVFYLFARKEITRRYVARRVIELLHTVSPDQRTIAEQQLYLILERIGNKLDRAYLTSFQRIMKDNPVLLYNRYIAINQENPRLKELDVVQQAIESIISQNEIFH